MENDLKGNENYFDLTGGSSYRESTVVINQSINQTILTSILRSVRNTKGWFSLATESESES